MGTKCIPSVTPVLKNLTSFSKTALCVNQCWLRWCHRWPWPLWSPVRLLPVLSTLVPLFPVLVQILSLENIPEKPEYLCSLPKRRAFLFQLSFLWNSENDSSFSFFPTLSFRDWSVFSRIASHAESPLIARCELERVSCRGFPLSVPLGIPKVCWGGCCCC